MSEGIPSITEGWARGVFSGTDYKTRDEKLTRSHAEYSFFFLIGQWELENVREYFYTTREFSKVTITGDGGSWQLVCWLLKWIWSRCSFMNAEFVLADLHAGVWLRIVFS